MLNLIRIATRVAEGWSLESQLEEAGLMLAIQRGLSKNDKEELAVWLDAYLGGKPVADDQNTREGEVPLPEGIELNGSVLTDGLVEYINNLAYDIGIDLEIEQEDYTESLIQWINNYDEWANHEVSEIDNSLLPDFTMLFGDTIRREAIVRHWVAQALEEAYNALTAYDENVRQNIPGTYESEPIYIIENIYINVYLHIYPDKESEVQGVISVIDHGSMASETQQMQWVKWGEMAERIIEQLRSSSEWWDWIRG
jgi:hypothetical protein